jgi:hypothetical protein
VQPDENERRNPPGCQPSKGRNNHFEIISKQTIFLNLNETTVILNMNKIFLFALSLAFAGSIDAQQLDSIQSIDASAARQAVAVSDKYLFAIDNITVEQYDKTTGQKLKTWKDDSGALKHLNSGLVLDNKLYCAHSNFPEVPMASSIEVFDAETLEPVESHSLGIDIGSATWIDRHEGYWYIAFAHYSSGSGQEPGKDNRWTQLVKFTDDWQRVGAWIFPKALFERFGTMSNSGGFISKEGDIIITGHDHKELYRLAFPKMGYTLQWMETWPAPFEGQGIAVDPEDKAIIYGISRSQKKIIKAKLRDAR